MSLEPAFFPPLLSPGVKVVTAACPLEASARASLEASGFRLPEGLARAVASRQDEFVAGRYCALQALLQAGATGQPQIGVLADRSPAWPRGFVGSIAHSHGRAAAAVAREQSLASVGIDFEPVMKGKQASEVRRRILMPADEKQVLGLRGWNESERVTFVFSAKEAIYKCLRPLCGEFFGFEDAELTSVDEAGGCFSFVLKAKIGKGFESGWAGQGRFARREGWIYAAMEHHPQKDPASHLERMASRIPRWRTLTDI